MAKYRSSLFRSIALCVLLAAVMAAPSEGAPASANDNTSHESKMNEALTYHNSKSQQLLDRALQEGGASSSMEVGPDGTVVESDNAEGSELWQAEFALKALEREMEMLNDVKNGLKTNDDDDDDIDSEDDDDEDSEDESGDEEEEYYSGDSGDEEDYSGDSGDEEDYYSGDEEEDDYTFGRKSAGAKKYSGHDFDDGEPDYENVEDPKLKEILDSITDPEYKRGVYEDVLEEAEVAENLDSELWYQYRYWELHAYFSCAKVFAQPRHVYDTEQWIELRKFYHEYVKDDLEEKPLQEGEGVRSYQFSKEAYDPPLTPFQAGAKGRGLKAARDIPKGELVFKATNNTVIFTHGHTWRKFLFDIHERNDEPFDDETACDVLVWSWVQALEEDGPLVIVTDFDNGSLLNEGRDESGWESPNVRCGKEGDKMCMMEYYATKDIKEGDELLCDYREFALLDSWVDMGL